MPGVTVKVVGLMVAGFIACGKMAATTVLGHNPAEPLGGVTEMGGAGGRHGLAPVVKVHTKLLASGLPNMSRTPVAIVASYAVLDTRLLDGVKVKIVSVT